jgi:hypothetical protein
MAGALFPAARGQDAVRARCPVCGFGDLCSIRIARPLGEVWRGVYCAGEYDHDRRRILRRSCGYAGAEHDGALDAAGMAPADVSVVP